MSGVDLTPEERALFLQEAREQLEDVEAGLLALEERPDDAELVAGIFRAMHTLKGGAGTAGYTAMANLAHSLETLLDQVRSGSLRMSGSLADILLSGVDALAAALGALESDGEPDDAALEAAKEGVDAWSPDGAADWHGAEESASAVEAAVDAAGDAVDEEASEGAPSLDRVEAALAAGRRVTHWRIEVSTDSAMPSLRAYQALLLLEE